MQGLGVMTSGGGEREKSREEEQECFDVRLLFD